MAKVTSRVLARFLDDRSFDHLTISPEDRRYANYADELRAFIEIIQLIPPPTASIDTRTNARLRARLICELSQAQRRSRAARASRLYGRLASPLGWIGTVRPRIGGVPILLTAAVILFPTLLGRGVVYASAGTIPGETLYGVKVTVENVQVALAPGNEARAEILIAGAAHRVTEISRATREERADAARIAAEAYAEEVAEAQRALVVASNNNEDIGDVSVRLSADLEDQESAIAFAELHVPAEARPALARAHDTLASDPIEPPTVPQPAHMTLPSEGSRLAASTFERERQSSRATPTPVASSSTPAHGS